MSADPKLYREMEVPFASQEEAAKASAAFADDLAEIRKKHRMRDVAYTVMFSYESPEGESQAITSGHLGNSMNAESMLAYALGVVQSDRQAYVGSLLKGVKPGPRG